MPEPLKLHLGCGRDILPGWINHDQRPGPGIDVVADLDTLARERLPFPDGAIAEFRAHHLIEHLQHPVPFMQELHRVAKPGAVAVFRTPYGSSDDAWEDPTHVRPYFLDSFQYFGQPALWRADTGYRGDWQVVEVVLSVSKERWAGKPVEAIVEAVRERRNVVEEMTTKLVAVKPIRPQQRELLQQFPVGFHLV